MLWIVAESVQQRGMSCYQWLSTLILSGSLKASKALFLEKARKLLKKRILFRVTIVAKTCPHPTISAYFPFHPDSYRFLFNIYE